jgi:WD40 repeat protein
VRALKDELVRSASIITAKIGCLAVVALAFTGLFSALADDAAPVASIDSSATAGQDLDGDPLPAGAIARLGTKRFRLFRAPVAVTFVSDGKLLAVTTGDGWLQHWDPTTGKLVREKRFSDHPVADRPSAALAPGQLTVAVHGSYTDEDQRRAINWIRLVSQFSAASAAKLELKDRAPVEALALAPDGTTIAYAGDNLLHVIDAVAQKELAKRPLNPQDGRRAESLAFSPDGKTLAIGSDGKVQLWNWTTGPEPRSITIPEKPGYSSPYIRSLAYSPDGSQLAVPAGRDDQAAVLIDVATATITKTLSAPEIQYWRLDTSAFSPDGKLLAAPIEELNAGGGIALWDVATGKLIRRLAGLRGTATCLAFSADGHRLAAASHWDSTMAVWDIDTGKLSRDDHVGHVRPPAFVRFFGDDRQLASAGDDATIRIWNLTDSRQLRMMQHETNPQRHMFSVPVLGMDVSPDGKYVASSSYDDTDRLWDAATGREIYRLPGHSQFDIGGRVQFTPDSRRFASWGTDMRVYVWDMATGKALQEYRAQPQGVTLAPEGEEGSGDFRGLHGGLFSPDASTLYIQMDNVRRFEVSSGKELAPLDPPGWLGHNMALSRDNRNLLYCGSGPYRLFQADDGRQHSVAPQNHVIKLWGIDDNRELASLELAGERTGPVAFSPDGRLVAVTAGDDSPSIEIRKMPDLSQPCVISLPCAARAIEFSASSKLLAASLADCTILVWDLEHLPQPIENKP